MRRRSLLPVALTALAVLAGRAQAQDECATDADCGRLYRTGFRCVNAGTGAAYCLEPRCDDVGSVRCSSDADCTAACGEGSACTEGTCERRLLCETDDECRSGGGEAWCDLEAHEDEGVGYCTDDPRPAYFHGCAAAGGRGGRVVPALALLALLALLRLRRRLTSACSG